MDIFIIRSICLIYRKMIFCYMDTLMFQSWNRLRKGGISILALFPFLRKIAIIAIL